jgi:hypothetical protein
MLGESPISSILPNDWMLDTSLTATDSRGGKKLAKTILIQNDRLFLFTEPASASLGDRDFQTAVARFQQAFRSIWNRIPRPDRHQILKYWRDPKALDVGLPTKPLIQLLDVGPWDPSYVGVDRCGHALTFSLALAALCPKALPLEIARNLVHVYRYATGDFWRLFCKLVDEPLTWWEQQQGDAVSQAALDRKQSALGRIYLRHHEAKVAAVIRKWGIEAPSTCTGQAKVKK